MPVSEQPSIGLCLTRLQWEAPEHGSSRMPDRSRRSEPGCPCSRDGTMRCDICPGAGGGNPDVRDSDVVPFSWFPAGARMMHSILKAAQEESRASARAQAMYSHFEDMVSPIHRSVHHFEKRPIPGILVDPLIGTLRGNQVSPACIGCNIFLSSWDLDRNCRTTVTPHC